MKSIRYSGLVKLIVIVCLVSVSLFTLEVFGTVRSYVNVIKTWDKFDPEVVTYPLQSFLGNYVNSANSGSEAAQDFILTSKAATLTGIRNINPSEIQRQYKNGELRIYGERYNIKVRAKGISPNHFMGINKSFKIKAKNQKLISGRNSKLDFDLITNPSIVADNVAFEIAKELGLLIPDHDLLVGEVNNGQSRIYQVVASVDETMLRNFDLMAGDIYELEIEGFKNLDNAITPKSKSNLTNPLFWSKIAINNHYSPESLNPLNVLLSEFSRKNPAILNRFDKIYSAKLLIFFQLVQSRHASNSHNFALYYDSWKEKFFPIVVDQMAFHSKFGNSFTQTIPTEISAPVDYILPAQFSNELLNELAVDGEVKQLISIMWKQNRKKITSLLDTIPQKHQAVLAKINPSLVEVGSSFRKEAELIAAKEILIKHSAQSVEMLDEIVKSIDRLAEPKQTTDLVIIKSLDGEITISEDTDFSNVSIFVHPGTIFKMEPGVSIKFSNANFAGTTAKPIIFERSLKQEPFGGILFAHANYVGLQNVKVDGGSGQQYVMYEMTGQLNFHNVGNLIIDRLTASNNSIYDDNIHLAYVQNFKITNTTVSQSNSDGIDIDISKGSIEDSSVIDSGNDAIDSMTSDIKIINSLLKNSKDKGVSIGERSIVTIENTDFVGNNIGLEIKDKSNAYLINGSRFSSNGLDINLYKKNWRFGGGGSIILDPYYDSLKINSDKYSVVQYEK